MRCQAVKFSFIALTRPGGTENLPLMEAGRWAELIDAHVVGANVQRIRLSKTPKISTRKLAALSGLSRPTITSLEAGTASKGGVNMTTVTALADALGVSPIELIMPETASAAMEPVVAEFQASGVAAGLGVTEEELAWLRSFPTITWSGARPDPPAIAELILWRRRNTGAKEGG